MTIYVEEIYNYVNKINITINLSISKLKSVIS